MNTLEAIKTRRSTRRFSDKRVEVKNLIGLSMQGAMLPAVVTRKAAISL